MFCENCGIQLKDGAKFCPNCGTPCSVPPVAQQQPAQQPYQAAQQPIQAAQQPVQPAAQAPQNNLTNEVKLYPDGKYRWTYEVQLWKNASIFLDLVKVMGIIMVGIWLFVTAIIPLLNGDFDGDDFLEGSKVFLWIILGMAALCGLGYALFAAINGGSYAVLFIMDENTVVHRQMPRHMKRAQVIAALAILMDPMASGPAVLAASQSDFRSYFKKVRQVIPDRKHNRIKVNEVVTHNRIYVEDPNDYEFVLNYIKEHCPNAKKK